ncbi:MAG: Ig-like domain-containing protein [Carboxydocellales bacterium]
MPTEGQAPHVRFITPGPGAVVPTNIKSWYFEFNKPIQANSLQNNVQMRKVTFNSTSMTDSTAMTGPTFTPVNGLMVTPIVDQASPNLAVAAKVYFSESQSPLDALSEYELVLKPGIVDVNNIPLNGWYDPNTSSWMGNDHVVGFSTGAGLDDEAPKILATKPVNAATAIPVTNIPVDTDVSVVFSEDIDKDSLFPNKKPAIILSEVDSQGTVLARVYGDYFYEHERKLVVITPDSFLKPNTNYKIAVPADIKDLVGNATASEFTTTFTTGGPITDTNGPTVVDAKAFPFEVSPLFNEDLLFDVANRVYTATYSPLNFNNYTLEVLDSYSNSWNAVDLSHAEIFYNAASNTVHLTRLFLQPGAQFRLKVTNLKDRSGNLVDNTANSFTGTVQEFLPNSGTAGGPTGGGGSSMPMEKPKPEAWPNKAMAGAQSEYHIGVPIFGPEGDKHYTLGAGSTIEVTFPEGFDVTNAQKVNVDTKYGWDPYANVSGSGGLTVASISKDIASRKVIVTLGGTGTTGEPDFVSFPLAGIKNSDIPQKPGSIGYKVTVTTKDGGVVKALNLESYPFFINEIGTRQIQVKLADKTDITKTPIAELDGIPVRMDSVMTGFQKAATTDGAVYFNQLSEGFYNVWIDPVITVNGHDYLTNEIQKLVEIKADSPNPQVVTFELVNTATATNLGTISGTITGGPANETVMVWASNPGIGNQGYFEKEITLDANGGANFTFKAGIGNWLVGVRPAFNLDMSANTFMSANWIPSPPQQVEIKTAAAIAQLNLSITTADKTISGKVQDENGVGIAFADVFAYSPNGFGYPASARTASDGSYTLKVPAGSYTVGAFLPGLPPMPNISVVVKPDQSGVTGADFRVYKPNSTISGQVTDVNNNAITNAPVWAHMENGLGTANTETDDQGNYTLYVTSGTWIVQAFAPGYGPLGTKTVVLDNNTTAATDKNFSPSGSFSALSGTVAWNADGTNGVSGAMIWAEGINGTTGGNGAITESDGSFNIKVPYGAYRLHAFVPGLGDLTPVEVNADVPTVAVVGFKGLEKGTLLVQFQTGGQAFTVTEGFINVWGEPPPPTYSLRGRGFKEHIFKGVGRIFI